MKQNVVALSSCELEYNAASVVTFHGVWIVHFVEEILKIKVKPFKFQVDNKSAIALRKNPTQHVSMESQLPDSFTTFLNLKKFMRNWVS